MFLKFTIKDTDFYEQIMSYVLLISICIGGYIVPNTNLSLGLFSSFIISAIIFFYYIIFKKKIFFFSKWISMFVLYVIISQLALSILSGEVVIIKRLFTVVITTFTLFVFSNLINEENFFKAYCALALICSVGLLYHSILVYLYKQPISPIVIMPRIFVPTTNWALNMLRPMSFFQEPQAYSGFMIPILIYTLFNRKYIISAFFVLCIFLSTSTTGILLAVGICGYVVLLVNRNKTSSYIFILLLIILFIFSINSNLFTYTINKIINISFNNERLSNGFRILQNLEVENLIFGVGAGNIYNIIYEKSLSLPKYFSTFSGIIIDYGFLGILLYCFMILKLYKSKTKMSKLFILIIFVLSFTQTILFNTAFINYYVSFFIVSSMSEKDYFMFMYNGKIRGRE